MKSWLRDGVALVGAVCVVGGALAYDMWAGVATIGVLILGLAFLMGDDDATD